jgi:hypothetical protein
MFLVTKSGSFSLMAAIKETQVQHRRKSVSVLERNQGKITDHRVSSKITGHHRNE